MHASELANIYLEARSPRRPLTFKALSTAGDAPAGTNSFHLLPRCVEIGVLEAGILEDVGCLMALLVTGRGEKPAESTHTSWPLASLWILLKSPPILMILDRDAEERWSLSS